jgi:hypothetical protein
MDTYYIIYYYDTSCLINQETVFCREFDKKCLYDYNDFSSLGNVSLKELKADGTVAEISTKWFGSDITTIK